MIDLHTHSTASDGTLAPIARVAAACEAGLSALALTDHDTVSGLKEAIDAAFESPVVFVPGVELSVDLPRGALHIVGLHVDHQNARLLKILDWVVDKRQARNRVIVQKLTDLGMPIQNDELEALAGGGVIGRPHFAALMIEKGYVKTIQSAFQRFLMRGKPAYEIRQRLDSRQAIEAIRSAGGVPVLAHPDQTHLEGEALDVLVKELADLGLAGIEVYCSGYTSSQSRQYSRLAEKYNLVRSGGSDFHGAIKPGIKLGRGPGKLHVQDDLLGPIAERAARIRQGKRRERVGIEPT